MPQDFVFQSSLGQVSTWSAHADSQANEPAEMKMEMQLRAFPFFLS